jgi:hypothetical protein
MNIFSWVKKILLCVLLVLISDVLITHDNLNTSSNTLLNIQCSSCPVLLTILINTKIITLISYWMKYNQNKLCSYDNNVEYILISIHHYHHHHISKFNIELNNNLNNIFNTSRRINLYSWWERTQLELSISKISVLTQN